jgi:adenylate kinase family enzyme
MSNASGRHRALLLLGPTGAGKTPLGDLIEERGLWDLSWAHFDFGDQLRKIAAGDSAEGRFGDDEVAAVQRVLDAGALLENEDWPLAQRILREFLAERMLAPQACVVLNGLPRHIDQAKAVDAIIDVGTVLSLRCTSETVLHRIRANVPGDRAGRDDDDEEMVRAKIALYYERTAALVEHYRERDIPIRRIVVTANMTADDIWRILQRRGC